MMLWNPYLDLFLSLPSWCRRTYLGGWDTCSEYLPGWLDFKLPIVSAYSWAVPTEKAILTIRRHANRLIEIGSGNGYWAWLLWQAGAHVRAFEIFPPLHVWYPIEAGNELESARFPDHALFLCWPPQGSNMADDALRRYSGDVVVYVGEWMVGCATPEFFWRLREHFHAVDVVELPQWSMRHDRLLVFRRNYPGSGAPR